MHRLIAHAEIKTGKGAIKGSCAMEGREGTIRVHDIASSQRLFEHAGVQEMRDFFHGPPRSHGPFTLCKSMDESTPHLVQALANTTLIREVIVRLYRIDKTGHEEHYFTFTLENALVTGFSHDDDLEYVSFAYEKITWRHETANIETQDTWQTLTTGAPAPEKP